MRLIRDINIVKGKAIFSIQIDELSEFAKLRWDGAIQLITVEDPERPTM